MKYNITEEETRIHAHVCCDGCLSTAISRRCLSELIERPNRTFRNRYVVEYWNLDPILKSEFIQDVKKAYKRKCVAKNKVAKVDGKWIYQRLKSLGAGKSREWEIPEDVMFGNPENKKQWIRVMIDDEGTITKHGGIRIKSVNRRGLLQVMNMFKSLGIRSHITPFKGSYTDGSFYLVVEKKEVSNLIKVIGPLKHLKKQERLKSIFILKERI